MYLSYFYSLPLDTHLWPVLERGCWASWAFDLAQHSHSLCLWHWGSSFWNILSCVMSAAENTRSSTPTQLCTWDLAVVVTFRQRHVTHWLQCGTNCWILNFCWKCSGSGKGNLTFPVLCASFSPAIRWLWRYVCHQEYCLCSILERILLLFSGSIGQGTEPREGKAAFPL